MRPAALLALLVGLLLTTVAFASELVIGVHVNNPQRLDAAAQDGLLDQLQAAQVGVVRAPLAPPWGGDDYRPALDFIRKAWARGIRISLIVNPSFPKNAAIRPAVKELPDMWPGPPLSAADPELFRTVFTGLLDEIEGAGITLAALELGNEINWTAFNGEFPIPGQGKVFGADDLRNDPEARQIAKGFDAYLRTLAVLKEIRDGSRHNRRTPIISAGLADPGPAGPRPGSKTDAVSIDATLRYLRERGLDRLVDAYGVHTYTDTKASRQAFAAHLRTLTLGQCGPARGGRPCWLTEWGVKTEDQACPPQEAIPAQAVRRARSALDELVEEGSLVGLIYYAWSDPNYGIHRCGSFTETGRAAIAPPIFDPSQRFGPPNGRDARPSR